MTDRLGDLYVLALLRLLVGIERIFATPDHSQLIACPTCRARLTERCKTATGKPRHDHGSRLITRRCPCGATLGEWRKLCDRCHRQNKRTATREASVRLRARRRRAAA